MTDADIAIIDGTMGLYDSRDGVNDAGSTAEIAKWFGAPVVLVVDCSSLSRSVAAVVKGCLAFDPSLRIPALVFNKVENSAHTDRLMEAISAADLRVEVLGGIPNVPAVASQDLCRERASCIESHRVAAVVTVMASLADEYLNLEAILSLAETAKVTHAATQNGLDALDRIALEENNGVDESHGGASDEPSVDTISAVPRYVSSSGASYEDTSLRQLKDGNRTVSGTKNHKKKRRKAKRQMRRSTGVHDSASALLDRATANIQHSKNCTGEATQKIDQRDGESTDGKRIDLLNASLPSSAHSSPRVLAVDSSDAHQDADARDSASSFARNSDRDASPGEETTAHLEADAGQETELSRAYDDEEPRSHVRIAVARDEAFCFYYRDNLSLLQDAGAELVYFSPLTDALPSNIVGLFLGGGFPELYASHLSNNKILRAGLKAFAETGGVVYAECGGLLLLSQSLQPQGQPPQPMAGFFPFKAILPAGPPTVGYVEVEVTAQNPLFPAGWSLRGYVHHASELVEEHHVAGIRDSKDYGTRESSASLIAMGDQRHREPKNFSDRGGDGSVSSPTASRSEWGIGYVSRSNISQAMESTEGFCKGYVLGSYVHINFGGCPELATAIVERCKRVDPQIVQKAVQQAEQRFEGLEGGNSPLLQANEWDRALQKHRRIGSRTEEARGAFEWSMQRMEDSDQLSPQKLLRPSIPSVVSSPELHRINERFSKSVDFAVGYNRSMEQLSVLHAAQQNLLPPYHQRTSTGRLSNQCYDHDTRMGGHTAELNARRLQTNGYASCEPSNGGLSRIHSSGSLGMATGRLHAIHTNGLTNVRTCDRMSYRSESPSQLSPTAHHAAEHIGHFAVGSRPSAAAPSHGHRRSSSSALIDHRTGSVHCDARSSHASLLSHEGQAQYGDAYTCVEDGVHPTRLLNGRYDTSGVPMVFSASQLNKTIEYGSNGGGGGVSASLTPTTYPRSISGDGSAFEPWSDSDRLSDESSLGFVERGFQEKLTVSILHVPSAMPTLKQQQQHATVARTNDKIVTLGPGVTEIAWALGLSNRIVAVSDECDYPPDVASRARAIRHHGAARPGIGASTVVAVASAPVSAQTSTTVSPMKGALVSVPSSGMLTVAAVSAAQNANKHSRSLSKSSLPVQCGTSEARGEAKKFSELVIDYKIDEQVLARERPGLVLFEEDMEEVYGRCEGIDGRTQHGSNAGRKASGGDSNTFRCASGGGASSTKSRLSYVQDSPCPSLRRRISSAVVSVGLEKTCSVIELGRSTLSDVLDGMLAIGELAGVSDEAHRAVERLRARLRRVAGEAALAMQSRESQCFSNYALVPGTHQSDIDRTSPKVLVLRSVQPFVAEGFWVPDMVTLAGGEPLPLQAGETATVLSWSQVVKLAPDVIIIAGLKDGASAKVFIDLCVAAALPGWWLLPAVRSGMVFVCEAALFLRSGPRLVDGIEALARMIHGDAVTMCCPPRAVLKLSLRPGQRCRPRLLPNYFMAFT